MKPEYEAIYKDMISRRLVDRWTEIYAAIERCEALAAKPPREFIDAECMEIWEAFERCDAMVASVRLMLAKADEIRARPADPETVPLDYEKWWKGGWQAINIYGNPADALIPGHNYTMRRKP